MVDGTIESGLVDIDMAEANRLPPRGEEFIRIVIRFEYALKEIGYCRAGGRGGVEVCWDDFANKCLDSGFFKNVQDTGIANTLLVKPPSKQTIRGGKLDTDDAKNPENVQELFAAVRRTRNNLLHGGKSGDIDHDRNAVLVAESIAVLTKALESQPDLRFMFEGRW